MRPGSQGGPSLLPSPPRIRSPLPVRRERGVVVAPALVAFIALAITFTAALPAQAHSPGESFLALTPSPGGGGSGRWEIALRDLDEALVLDADGDGAITWGELRRRAPEVARHALGQLALSTPAGPCAPRNEGLAITHHDSAAGSGTYAALTLALGCPADGASGGELTVDYRLFFDRDRQHRALVQVAGSAQQSAVARADRPRLRFTAATAARTGRPPGTADGASVTLDTLGRYLVEGVRHIWQGLDHLLFLLVLLHPRCCAGSPAGGRRWPTCAAPWATSSGSSPPSRWRTR
jgi:hypothetical protein